MRKDAPFRLPEMQDYLGKTHMSKPISQAPRLPHWRTGHCKGTNDVARRQRIVSVTSCTMGFLKIRYA